MEVKANVVVLAGEGVVLAICRVLPKVKFGYMKVGFDVTLVLIACILSILFIGHLQGVREGDAGCGAPGWTDREAVREAYGWVEAGGMINSNLERQQRSEASHFIYK